MARGKIIPSIRYKNCPEAIDWLARAFSFTPHFVVPGNHGEILPLADHARGYSSTRTKPITKSHLPSMRPVGCLS